jgi:drug/metabolite transporter (DMT)-like permease
VFGVPLVYLIQFEGLARTTVAHASLMVAMFPILLGVAAAALAGERVPMRRWMLLLVSAIGALLIVSGLGWSGIAGALLIIGAAVGVTRGQTPLRVDSGVRPLSQLDSTP